MNLYDEFFTVIPAFNELGIDAKTIAEATETPSRAGVVRVATKRDLVWLKRFRNSDQDRADIAGLGDDKD